MSYNINSYRSSRNFSNNDDDEEIIPITTDELVDNKTTTEQDISTPIIKEMSVLSPNTTEDSGNELRKNWWKLLLAFIVTILVIALDSSFMKIDNSTFDNSKSPLNSTFTPPINQNYPYGRNSPIHGVNLGGWLVLDPLIVPSFFNSDTLDEYSVAKSLDPDTARAKFIKHYDEFVTEDDFQKMSEFGLNHVRIPIGFWAIEVLQGEPFVPYASWQFLLRGINWARKYGLRVFVDLHKVPDINETLKDVGYGAEKSNRTLRYIKALANFFNGDNYTHVTSLLGPIDTTIFSRVVGNLSEFYNQSYYEISASYDVNSRQPYVVFDEASTGFSYWSTLLKSFPRAILGSHRWFLYDVPKNSSSDYEQLALSWSCEQKSNFTNSQDENVITIATEWAAAVYDCAHIRAINGSLPQSLNYTCDDDNNWQNWNQTKKEYLLNLTEAQMEAYESGSGWFYWTWKTENNSAPKFDYKLGEWMDSQSEQKSYNFLQKPQPASELNNTENDQFS
ncbi:3837_t:CDS:2 [Ambispora leptoticha]|uniref:glucan 1,3-beta-glucosidase n=1 Tax=Ambispora leptoticha TaxID=144679 RepID=A0A9N9BTJ3_9GLOM|nr:3837_t:CDS:2 [Ambispora leptoticha]